MLTDTLHTKSAQTVDRGQSVARGTTLYQAETFETRNRFPDKAETKYRSNFEKS
jgi:hypothetical protein